MLNQPLLFAKVKSQVFIDNLVVELFDNNSPVLKAVLKDEQGIVCSALETKLHRDQQFVIWKGLNDLPYGIYSLELFDGAHEMKTRMVKRV
jgi:hypothetical protein